MRRLAPVLFLVLASCATSTGSTTTAVDVPNTFSPAPPTTVAALEYEAHNCAAPPVTFSALCEIYDLIQEWHVDRPISDAALAEIAVEALTRFETDETETAPRKLICSVPTEAFTPLGAQIALMVDQSSVPIGDAVEAAVGAMTDLGLDPFSYYLTPEQASSFRGNGVVGGVGVLLDATDAAGSRCTRIADTCPLTIVFVLENNPGEEAGLQAGDRITAVDGVPVDGQGFVATAGEIAGDETGTVVITYLREGVSHEATIQRAELSVPTVTVDMPVDGIGYLRIPDFEDDIPGLVTEALTSLADFSPHTIVIDLRDNPGGLIDAAVDVASMFVDGGTVMTSVGPDEELTYPASEGGLATSERLIVLVNGGTASSAEILAGALDTRRDATLVGTTTFGKDAVQIPFPLRNGGAFHVAVARWFTPEGTTVADGGLIPDRLLELDPGLTNEEIARSALEAAS